MDHGSIWQLPAPEVAAKSSEEGAQQRPPPSRQKGRIHQILMEEPNARHSAQDPTAGVRDAEDITDEVEDLGEDLFDLTGDEIRTNSTSVISTTS